MPPVRRRSTRETSTTPSQTSRKRMSDKAKPLPLVERTNKLSPEEFVTLYIPSSELRFQKKKKKKNISSHKTRDAVQNDTELEVDQAHRPEGTPESKDEAEEYTLDIYTATTIPTADFESCFHLIQQTSSTAYKDSTIGWTPTGKKKEMKLPDMKYMILRRTFTSNKKGPGDGEGDGAARREFAGFLEFMVTYEDGKEVLYCYEIHLVPEVQGQRLGEELMARLERIGQRIGLEKTMLTVFRSNTGATRFYERVGYAEDDSSPRPRRLRNGTIKWADYRIMSKMLR